MKVILNSDVYNLGEEGDVCEVARGFARNFLLPRDLAVPCTKQNLAMFEHKKAAIDKRKEEKRKAALSLKERIEELSLTIKMPVGETGKLFGSVNNAVVAEALQKEGISVERKKIDIPEHSIRMVGKYEARIKLYSDEVAVVAINVVSDKEVEAAPEEAAPAEEASEAAAENKAAAADAADAAPVDTADAETQE